MATESPPATVPEPFRVAVIIGSTRNPRAGPQIAQWVVDQISHSTKAEEQHPPSAPRPDGSSSSTTLHPIDLADWPLPLLDEPAVPSQVAEVPSGYAHAHTRAWSAEIASYSAFIFVTPQYNWGYPAALKNAIDYLFKEWKGKPAMVVSYGGRGGTKAGTQLRDVLRGCRMDVVDLEVALAFPGRDVYVAASEGKPLGLAGHVGAEGTYWIEERGRLTTAWKELLEKLEGTSKEMGKDIAY